MRKTSGRRDGDSPAPSPDRQSQARTEETLNARITNLEKRLEASDSIYRLNVQTQALREKEGREKLAAIARSMNDLERRVRTTDSDMHYLDDVIRKIIQEEVLSLTPHVLPRKSPEIEERVTRLRDAMTDAVREAQGRFLSLTQKVTEIDADGVIAVRERLARLRRNQEQMIETLSTVL